MSMNLYLSVPVTIAYPNGEREREDKFFKLRQTPSYVTKMAMKRNNNKDRLATYTSWIEAHMQSIEEAEEEITEVIRNAREDKIYPEELTREKAYKFAIRYSEEKHLSELREWVDRMGIDNVEFWEM